ncbi:MAG: PKD domain-containing protein [Planctomycetota bacterium]
MEIETTVSQPSYGRVVTLSATHSSDPDAGPRPLSFRWSQAPGEPRIEPLTTLEEPELTFRAPYTQADLHLTCAVSDGESTARSTIEIRVRNTPPQAAAGSDRIADPLSTVVLNGTASRDPDVPPLALAYSWTSFDGIPLSDPTSPTPAFSAPATAATLTFGLEVSDGFATSEADTVVIETTRQPVADAGPNRTVQPGELVTLDGTASFDPEGSPLSFSWTFPEGVLPTPPDSLTSPTPSFVAPASEGPLDFFLVVSDGDRESLPGSVRVTVDAGLLTPVAHAGHLQEASLSESGIVLLGVDSQGAPEGGAVQIEPLWELVSDGGAGFSFEPQSGFVAELHAPSVLADLLFRLTVTDDTSGLSNQDSVWVRVLEDAGNAPPEAVAEADSPDARPGQLVTLSGSGSSDDGQPLPLTYRWFQVEGPPVELLDPPTAEVVTFQAPDPGDAAETLRFQLVVSDGLRYSLPNEVAVTVSADGMPIADITVEGGDTHPVCSTVNLDSSGSFDSDDIIDGWEWWAEDSELDERLNWAPDKSSPQVSITLPGDYVMTIKILLRVRAGGEWSAPASTLILPTNSPPVVTAASITPADLLNALATATLEGDARDDDRCQGLHYSWTQVVDEEWPELDVEIVPDPADERRATFVAPPANLARERGAPTAALTFRLAVTDDAGDSTFSDVSVDLLPGFVHDVLDGVLEGRGCAECHNAVDAPGGFGPLSYDEIARECTPSDPGHVRIRPSSDRLEVERSLLLLRPSGVGHETGPTLWAPGDLDYETLVWWLLGGGLWDNGSSGTPRDDCSG